MNQRNKHNAVAVVVDGIRFASKMEARRYGELKLLVAAGVITELTLQPRFLLQEKFTDSKGTNHRAINYVGDFQYIENGVTVVEDVKGMETKVFKINKKLFLYRYRDIDFRLITYE